MTETKPGEQPNGTSGSTRLPQPDRHPQGTRRPRAPGRRSDPGHAHRRTHTRRHPNLDRRRDHPQGSHPTLRAGRHGPSPVMNTAPDVDVRHIVRDSCVVQ